MHVIANLPKSNEKRRIGTRMDNQRHPASRLVNRATPKEGRTWEVHVLPARPCGAAYSLPAEAQRCKAEENAV